MQAMEEQQVDLVKRMKTIKSALDERDDTDEQVLCDCRISCCPGAKRQVKKKHQHAPVPCRWTPS
jgi:hypothetical protein